MPRISDARLAEMYQRREELRERAGKLTAKADDISDRIVAELQRRGTDTFTNGGQRVTLVSPESVSTDYAELQTILRRSAKGRAILARVEKTVVDGKAVAGEVLAGNIAPSIVARVSTINKSKPYLRGSKVD